jgi:hypothetical protein
LTDPLHVVRGAARRVPPPSAQSDVLGDSHRWNECEVLMHHPDSGGNRIAWRAKINAIPFDVDRASIGSHHPECDAHERRLPSTIFAEEGVNRSRSNGERRLVERSHIAKPLGDPMQLERERSHRPVGALMNS